MSQITYKLVTPLKMTLAGPEGEHEEITTELTVRRPVAKDLRIIDGHAGEVAKILAMIARLTGLAMVEVDNLSIADVSGLTNIIEGFMEPGLPTGQTA